MSKYIDKDELWERLKKHMVHHIVTNTLFNTIKAVIDGMPTIEVSEDCISREYLLSKVYDMDNDNLVVDLKDIENAPSRVPSRAEGEWIINEPIESGFGTIFECPYCKYEVEFEPTNYCPNCGAKMRLE